MVANCKNIKQLQTSLGKKKQRRLSRKSNAINLIFNRFTVSAKMFKRVFA